MGLCRRGDGGGFGGSRRTWARSLPASREQTKQEKGLRGSGAGTLGVPLGGTRRVGGLLGASDLRNLLSVPLRSQGHCGVGRGLSELHWVWCC